MVSLYEGLKTAQQRPTIQPKRDPIWPQSGLYEGPRRSKMASKTAKEGPRGPKTAQERSKLSLDGLKMT